MIFPVFPPAASRTAEQVDALFSYLMAVCGLFLAGIAGVITYFLIKYRRGRPAFRQQRKVSSYPFEITWTIIPLLFFMSFFVWGASIYHSMESSPSNGLEIHVIAKQWMWKIQHETGNREIDQLHVPVGRDIKLVMATQDVIHSFFLPAFRVKQDVVPGRYNTLWFHATKTGNFPIYCAEYCGADHSFMVGRVIVMTPADYEAWLAKTRPTQGLAAQGAHLFRDLGCSGCHMGSSVVRAPQLEGLFGKPVPLADGQIVQADAKYIHDKILYPDLQVPAGYKPLMPSFKGHVTEEQIFDLVAYLKSLGDKVPELRPGERRH
jgi:cytochrome c oxidase subunit 2